MAYLCAKFDNSSFSRLRDMVGAHRNLSGLLDLTTPLSGIACNPWTSTDYVRSTYLPNLKSLTPPTMRLRKAIQNIENWVVWVVRGHSRSLEIAPFNRAHTSWEVPISVLQ